MCSSHRPLNGADSEPLPFTDDELDRAEAHAVATERRGMTYDDFEPDDYRFGDAWADIESAIWERE